MLLFECVWRVYVVLFDVVWCLVLLCDVVVVMCGVVWCYELLFGSGGGVVCVVVVLCCCVLFLRFIILFFLVWIWLICSLLQVIKKSRLVRVVSATYL